MERVDTKANDAPKAALKRTLSFTKAKKKFSYEKYVRPKKFRGPNEYFREELIEMEFKKTHYFPDRSIEGMEVIRKAVIKTMKKYFE